MYRQHVSPARAVRHTGRPAIASAMDRDRDRDDSRRPSLPPSLFLLHLPTAVIVRTMYVYSMQSKARGRDPAISWHAQVAQHTPTVGTTRGAILPGLRATPAVIHSQRAPRAPASARLQAKRHTHMYGPRRESTLPRTRRPAQRLASIILDRSPTVPSTYLTAAATTWRSATVC